MTKEQIAQYRNAIENTIIEKDSQLGSYIYLIIIGALGLFMTANEKFIGIRQANHKCLMFLSIACLIIAFFVFLWEKHLTQWHARKILNYIDNKLIPDQSESAEKMLKVWKKCDKKLIKVRNSLYILVFLGVLLELIFFLANLLAPQISDKKNMDPVKIEITIKDSSNKTIQVKRDTIK